MIIRRAKPEEVFEVKTLLSSSWSDTYHDFLSPETIHEVTNTWHDPERLRNQIEDSQSYFIVAEKNKQIVGLLSAKLLEENILHIFRLYVDMHKQRSGIGSQLLDTALHTYPHAQKVQLEVEEKNLKAQQFYFKHGFQRVGIKDERVGNEQLKVFVLEKVLHHS